MGPVGRAISLIMLEMLRPTMYTKIHKYLLDGHHLTGVKSHTTPTKTLTFFKDIKL